MAWAMHRGRPVAECCHRVAPAPATRWSPMQRAPPSKATSYGHVARSPSGEGLEGVHTSVCALTRQVVMSVAWYIPQAGHCTTTQFALASCGATVRGRGHQPAPGASQGLSGRSA